MSARVQPSLDELYTIAIAGSDQVTDVLRIMRENFYYEETMFKSLCSSCALSENEKKNITEYFDGTIRAALAASPCILAVHNATSEIVGVNITTLSESPKTGKHKDGLATIFSSKSSVPPLVGKYIEYLSRMNDEANLFHRFPNARAMWEFYAIAIDKDHRKLGLASHLMRAGMNLAKSANVPLVFGVFTSIYSRKSAEKIGMKAVEEFDLSAYKDANGRPVFKNVEPHNIVSVMVIEI